jgi:NAD(P)-dependent dehydrogenase (short-subunit alcohol dehydrogenase family)
MKNIVIIGASSGIGLCIAEKLSIHNNVFGTYHMHEMASRETLHYFYVDVLGENFDFSHLPEEIHGLCYCPGSINLKPFARIKEEDFIQDYKLNVIGAIKCIQALLPNLKKAGTSSIVLFSTVAVQMGMGFHSIVSCSKGAIEGLTKALSAELAPTIRVNCIAPSLTDTPLATNLLNSDEKKLAGANRHPLKKIGTVQDIANAAIYLLNEDSTWVTGQILHVDGGMSTIKMI